MSSSWRDAFEECRPEDTQRAGEWDHVVESHYDLCDFLLSTQAGKPLSPPAPGSISLWVEDYRLKCCLKVKAKGVYAFIVIQNPLELWSEVETALHQGQLEWRREGARKRS